MKLPRHWFKSWHKLSFNRICIKPSQALVKGLNKRPPEAHKQMLLLCLACSPCWIRTSQDWLRLCHVSYRYIHSRWNNNKAVWNDSYLCWYGREMSLWWSSLRLRVSILCAGQVVCGSSHSAAHIHSIPDEETAASWDQAREGGGLGGGDIRRTLCDTMEGFQQGWAAWGAVWSAVDSQGGTPDRREDPELVAASWVWLPPLCVLQHRSETPASPSSEERSSCPRLSKCVFLKLNVEI